MDFLNQLIVEMHDDSDQQVDQIKDELSLIRDVLADLVAKYKTLAEAVDVSIDTNADVKELLQRAIDRFNAARRALGIIKDLPPGDKRGYHVSRIFGNMNRLRGLVSRIRKLMNTDATIEDEELHKDKYHPDLLKLSSDVEFDVAKVLRKMGYQADKQTTTSKESHVWDESHYDSTVFKKKDSLPMLVKKTGQVYDHSEGKYVHPCQCEDIYNYLKSNDALHVLKMNNGRSTVHINKAGAKKLGILK